MPPGSTLLMAGLIALAIGLAASAASKKPEVTWNYYHFDGSRFVAGQPVTGTPFLAIRDHARPVVMTGMNTAQAVPLPGGSGALAVICYIQSSGGKLSGGRGYVPCPRTLITIYSGNAVAASVESDESGYVVVTLPAGIYRIVHGVFTVEVRIENGTTALVPLRTGKRMVD